MLLGCYLHNSLRRFNLCQQSLPFAKFRSMLPSGAIDHGCWEWTMTRKEWYDYPRRGPCDVCKKRAYRQAHHAIREQDIPKSQKWNVNNRMLVCTDCHYAHSHFGVNDTRIEFDKVPDRVILFGEEVLGIGPTIENFCRYYRGHRSLVMARIEDVVRSEAA